MEPLPTHPVIEEVLKARNQQLHARIELIVNRYRQNWGDSLWKQAAALDGKPRVVALDFFPCITNMYEQVLKKCIDRVTVITSFNGSDMLVKVHVLKPDLIVTGLNVLHFCPVAYEWMLSNLARPDAVPIIFLTGASPSRWPREIPTKSPHVRVLDKFCDPVALRGAVQELLPGIARA